MTPKASSLPGLSIRIDLPGGARFGPGMAALLEAIDQHGSIRAAATSLDMSYPKALKLIEAMNAAFSEKLVDARHGGASKGGAELTPSGRRVLSFYHQLVSAADSATRHTLEDITHLLRPDAG